MLATRQVCLKNMTAVVTWTVASWLFGRYIRGQLDGQMMVV
jgi:hypothetical protein